jgi:hypothetical protein
MEFSERKVAGVFGFISPVRKYSQNSIADTMGSFNIVFNSWNVKKLVALNLMVVGGSK